MGSDCQMPPPQLGDLVRVTWKGLCRGIEATQRGTLVFVGDAQLIKESPVMGGGWSGVGELAHSSCQLSPPCPPNRVLGRKRVKREKYKG